MKSNSEPTEYTPDRPELAPAARLAKPEAELMTFREETVKLRLWLPHDTNRIPSAVEREL